ncbi:unnamed protein product [Rotaria sp. Silwood1]|nr:unnamed protein product [Rotaria sp. Silwood1]CAF3356205.1 unnamed protein product [Rotaria sp. Silwood1]CAF3383251.1 unnamed protein product [Rotaria sp. Silwood1]CAF4699315.1 unnamed protein product [Rotaria sp. Silwood1]CAF4949071.1 unnamed protein product [Rotaria sp. Silwood1]
MASNNEENEKRIFKFTFPTQLTTSMINEDEENDQTDFISHLRTVIILAARKSSSSDIDIDAVDKIVETTIDFVKNILEQMTNGNNLSSFSSVDLLNTIRLNPHLIPNRKLYLSLMETINHL